jgi:hypothetical protein
MKQKIETFLRRRGWIRLSEHREIVSGHIKSYSILAQAMLDCDRLLRASENENARLKKELELWADKKEDVRAKR